MHGKILETVKAAFVRDSAAHEAPPPAVPLWLSGRFLPRGERTPRAFFITVGCLVMGFFAGFVAVWAGAEGAKLLRHHEVTVAIQAPSSGLARHLERIEAEKVALQERLMLERRQRDDLARRLADAHAQVAMLNGDADDVPSRRDLPPVFQFAPVGTAPGGAPPAPPVKAPELWTDEVDTSAMSRTAPLRQRMAALGG